MPRKKASTHTAKTDVLIIGGGIMGTSAAWELARHGVRCLVLERSVPGAEASSAAAGILGAQAEAHAFAVVPIAVKTGIIALETG